MKKLTFLILFWCQFSVAGISNVTPFQTVRIDYSSTSVGTSSWVTLISATTQLATEMTIDDTSGQVFELGIGATPARYLIIPRGGFTGARRLYLSPGTKLSIRALTSTASSGDICVNLFNE